MIIPPFFRAIFAAVNDFFTPVPADKVLHLTVEQAGMLYEAAELLGALTSRMDDFDAFTEFNFGDMVLEAFPEVSGTNYSPAYRRIEAAIRSLPRPATPAAHAEEAV